MIYLILEESTIFSEFGRKDTILMCIFFVYTRNVKLTKSLSKSAEIEQKLPLYWCVFAFQKTDRNVVKSLSLYLDNLIMCIFISFILIEIIGGI